MPLISLKTSLPEIEDLNGLIKELSKQLSVLTEKPEQYVMAMIETNIPMSFSGSNEPCCYAEVKSIGSLKPNEMSEVLSMIISEKTKIPINRIYISFENIEGSKWGFNGRTFA
tara:strand:- start:377 stop:715 length:339 start_codon:yes stop_codon:yes gene_type:complete